MTPDKQEAKLEDFWITSAYEFNVDIPLVDAEMHLKEPKTEFGYHKIHVREVLPGDEELLKDRERLDWMIENSYHVYSHFNEPHKSAVYDCCYCHGDNLSGYFKTARDAIDAAMKEDKK